MYNLINTAVRVMLSDGGLTTAVIGLTCKIKFCEVLFIFYTLEQSQPWPPLLRCLRLIIEGILCLLPS